MRFREDNIKVLEQFYNQRQEALEEATAKKIQNLQRRIDELESQLDESQKLEKQKGMEIRDLLASRDDLRTKMGGL